MNERVAAVEPNGQNLGNFRPTDAGQSGPSEGPGSRFTYATGAKPLPGYTIKRGVGQGGFGEVYFATSDAGKEVALKLIRRNFDVELRGIKHCLNLKHPNLLAIYDIREDERDDNWVVMEYVSGDRLDDVILAHPNGMPIDQVLAWIHGIGAGVAYLHDHGIVHRDLKPGNVFSDEGIVKIGDYGLSKFISCSRRSGQTESVGTVHYMAPEVANGRYGKEIDVYALGVVLYEMLTGRVPFEGESVGEVLMKHLTARPDVSILPEPYRHVVARALEKDPQNRYRNMGEMLADLPKPPEGQVHVGPWTSAARAGGDGGAGGAGEPAHGACAAGRLEEEPIFAWVRQFCQKLHTAWHESNLDTPTKIILLAVGLFALAFTAGGWMPAVIFALVIYAVYWVLRAVLLSVFPPPQRWQDRCVSAAGEPASGSGPPPGGRANRPPPQPPPQPAAPPKPAPVAGRRRPRPSRLPHWARRERPADALVLKSTRERVTELLGSMLGGTLVSLVMCVVLVMLNSYRTGMVAPPQLWAWLMLVSVAGTWAVMIPSKFWEGSRGDGLVRRFVMMVVGLAVGTFAAGLAFLLQVDLPYEPGSSQPHNWVLPGFYGDGAPLLMAFMACFGTLFLAIRWWRLADPLRKTRLSLWATVFCVVMAWLVASLWLFPPTWLMMVACAASVAVQLASPWMHPRRRNPHRKFD